MRRGWIAFCQARVVLAVLAEGTSYFSTVDRQIQYLIGHRA
jgi:hypothetical protein